VKPNSIFLAIAKLKKLRSKDNISEAPIVMTNEFATLLDEFNPITVNS